MPSVTDTHTLTPITADIYQVRLPLPFALNHVNCYMLRGDAGWTILDAGLNTSAGRAGWEAVFAQLNIQPGHIEQIVLTHTHPDHYGLAGWLQAWSGAPVRLSAREWQFARQVWQLQDLPPHADDLFVLADTPPQVRQAIEAGTDKLRLATQPHPQQVELLEAGQTLRMGQREWLAIHAPGHADGQLIFYDAADRLLLCGDQVLMTISPHIGRWTLGDPDPLAAYLASLQELAQFEVRLALPGHRQVVTHWAERLAELAAHHAERLAHTRAAVNGSGATAYQVCKRVFVGEYSIHEMRFAVAETLAHLEYLVNQGDLRREATDVWLYRL